MRVLLQRVTRASVTVNSEVISTVADGVALLVGFGGGDDATTLEPMAKKVANLRVFEDESGRPHYSLLDMGYAALAVPQFTLYASTRKGRRPDFTGALEPAKASILFDGFVDALKLQGINDLQTGQFGAHMQVALVNDGPITLMLEL